MTADAEFSVLISKKGKVTIKKQGRDTEIKTLEPIDTRVLYLNMTNIYPMYTQQLKGEAFSLQSLNTYFESNEAYIGKVRSTRYRWQEVKEVPKGDILANLGSLFQLRYSQRLARCRFRKRRTKLRSDSGD